MSTVGPPPDISEKLREFDAYANGDVTLKDVENTAQAVAEDVGSEDDDLSEEKKVGKAQAAGSGISAGAEAVDNKELTEQLDDPLEVTAAKQESAGQAGFAAMGFEVSNSAPMVGASEKPEGTLTVADLNPTSHRKA